MDYKEFFKQHKNCLIYGHEDMVNFNVEEFFQAIKERLVDELTSLPRSLDGKHTAGVFSHNLRIKLDDAYKE